MDFISWLVVGVLFMLAEIGAGAFYLVAIGLACIYPAYYSFHSAPVSTQLTALTIGALIHGAIVMLLRRGRTKDKLASKAPNDIGQRVKVIEWMDECTAIVEYRGQQWQADKVDARMPDAEYGIIDSMHGSRIVISTTDMSSQTA